LPPRIVLDVQSELADYVLGELARHWPQARVRCRGTDRPAVADLLVVDREPGTPPTCPTLWLADINGSQALTELAPGYWRTAMPTTATRLRRTLQACLRALSEGVCTSAKLTHGKPAAVDDPGFVRTSFVPSPDRP
jgi:hypothetical protein